MKSPELWLSDMPSLAPSIGDLRRVFPDLPEEQVRQFYESTRSPDAGIPRFTQEDEKRFEDGVAAIRELHLPEHLRASSLIEDVRFLQELLVPDYSRVQDGRLLPPREESNIDQVPLLIYHLCVWLSPERITSWFDEDQMRLFDLAMVKCDNKWLSNQEAYDLLQRIYQWRITTAIDIYAELATRFKHNPIIFRFKILFWDSLRNFSTQDVEDWKIKDVSRANSSFSVDGKKPYASVEEALRQDASTIKKFLDKLIN